MKIVLVRPNSKRKQYGSVESLSACEPPIWLSILANYYKTDLIIDAELENYSPLQTAIKVAGYKPDKVIILATGNHPSAHIQQEEAMIRTAKCIRALEIQCEELKSLPVDPVKWSPPRYDLLNLELYRCHNWHSWSNNCVTSPYGTLFTSISCPFKCTFCTIKSFYGHQFEQRTLEDVFKDLDILAERKVKNIKIMDELFIFNRERVKSICEYIIVNDYNFNIWAYARIDIMDRELLEIMKKAGIEWLAYGIESGNDKIRKNVLKGNFDSNKIREVVKMTKEAGINVVGNYMFGFWEDNYETMKETFDFAQELNCEYANFYCVVAYPHSSFYQEMKEKGVELPTNSEEYAQMSSNFKPLPTKYLTAQEVLHFRDRAFDEYFTNNSYLNMMEKKFGSVITSDIKKMTAIKIIRKQ